MATLCISRRNRWILPNLEEVRFLRNDVLDCPIIAPALFSPKLTSVCFANYISARPQALDFQGPPEAIAPLIDALPLRCPTVTHIEVYLRDHVDVVVDAVTRFAYSCPCLEGFMVRGAKPWPIELLIYLARLPTLRKVYLELDDETAADMDGVFRDGTVHHPFHSLSYLHMVAPTISSGTQLLQIMNQTRLHKFHLTHAREATAAEMSDLFIALNKHCAHNILQIIEIRLGPDGRHLPEDEEFVISHLRPLFDFNNIRIFMMRTPLFYKLDNNAIREIADAWPSAIDIDIAMAWGGRTRPTVTWSAIGHVLSRCRQLIGLTLPFDPTIDDVEMVTSDPLFHPQHHFRFFAPLDCPHELEGAGAEKFAESLFALAPRVVAVAGGWYLGTDGRMDIAGFSPFCDQVNNIMWELRRTRMRPEFRFLDAYGETRSRRRCLF